MITPASNEAGGTGVPGFDVEASISIPDFAVEVRSDVVTESRRLEQYHW